jgi:hypothetical protein
MDIYIDMNVSQDGADFGVVPSFELLGFYPGAIQKSVKQGKYWLEWMDMQTILGIAHLIERAFRLNKMVVFKKPDNLTQKLLAAYRRKTRLDASMWVAINAEGGKIWQGKYAFDFYVESMIANQTDEDGNKWETLQLKIVDKTERISLME